jgi:GGDEF domain-containing protein
MFPALAPSTVLDVLAGHRDALSSPAATRQMHAFGAALATVAVGLAAVATVSGNGVTVLGALALAGGAVVSRALQVAVTSARRKAEALGWIDRRTGLYNLRGLAQAGEAALAPADGEGSLVVLAFTDLLEVHEIYGRDTSRRMQQRVVDQVRRLAGARGLAARTGGTAFGVLLPGLSQAQARAAVQAVLGSPARIELDVGDTEVVLVPDIVCMDTAGAHDRVDELYRAAVERIAVERDREQRRRLYLQRERERHSRPMGMPSRH